MLMLSNHCITISSSIYWIS